MAQKIEEMWVLSPHDVISEFECQHRVSLDAAAIHKKVDRPKDTDPALAILQRKGIEHERDRLDRISRSSRVVSFDMPGRTSSEMHDAWRLVEDAMRQEFDVIYQATLFTGDFVGFADFLILARDEYGAVVRDLDGRPLYEPVDAKSTRTAKRAAALQLGCYAETLVRLGMPEPRQVHLWLKGDADWHGEAAPLIALARAFRERLADRWESLGERPEPIWAAPRESCVRCRWMKVCETGRAKGRDLSLVQGIRSSTRERMVDAGIATIDALARADEANRPARVSRETFERLHLQAALQVRGEAAGSILVEAPEEDVLDELPPRSPLDLWFDMEGDPYANGGNGLEYMFGFGYLDNGAFGFSTTEAKDPTSECKAFEDFIDIVMDRWNRDPSMHVYHYADYERRTLRRLSQHHGTRENEIDALLRAGVLVDLYSIVRRALRFSTKSLSLKDIEKIYNVSHSDQDVTTAMDSVLKYESVIDFREDGDLVEAEKILDSIRAYNSLDCKSTMLLDSWLREEFPGHDTYSRTKLMDEDDVTRVDQYQSLIDSLEDGVPVDPAQRDIQQQSRSLLSAALQFHPREFRPAWWSLFELIKSDKDDLVRASDVLVAENVTASDWSTPPRARKERRTLEFATESDDPRTILEPGTKAFLLYDSAPEGMPRPSDSQRGYHSATVESVTDSAALVKELAGHDDATWPDLPIAILPGPPYNTDSIRAAIALAASSVVPADPSTPWRFPDRVWVDLLMARTPRQRSGSLQRTGAPIADIEASLKDSDTSYIAVQGPPGTGKTYVGSRVVASLASQGWRIAVVAQSHAVVDNLLAAVREADPSLAMGKLPASNESPVKPWHLAANTKIQDWAANQQGGYVIGGTAWTLTRPEVQALGIDLLVIDEAGQFSLPNAIACSVAVERVLLLGDPQQLPQVSRAAHPEGIESSVLAHVIARHPTMPVDRGYFLDETFRMHPDLTHVVSRLQYEGRLKSAPVTSMRSLQGVSPGVTTVPVHHEGNTTSSPEEAAEVLRLVKSLVGTSWIGARDNMTQPALPLTGGDIIVVAAYNAQVRLLRRTLIDAGFAEVAVGTVDKFQGREEVVVIVSMATSSDEDLPRGVDFLLSPNRLNVAISRAQWACYVVHSPALLQITPTSVEGMMRLGRFTDVVAGQAHRISGKRND